MTLSATAVQPVVSYALPAQATQDPAAAEAWMASLPLAVQQDLQQQLTDTYHSLPPTTQLEVQRIIIEKGGVPEFSPTVDGLDGLGDWGSAIVALAQVGAAVFNLNRSIGLQKDIAAGAQATSAQLAQAQIDAGAKAQSQLVDAENQAVKAKAVLNAQSQATMAANMPYILGGVGALALVIILIKFRKRTP